MNQTVQSVETGQWHIDHGKPGNGENDPVERPSHYCQGEVEFTDAIFTAMTPEERRGAMRYAASGYLWRMGWKGDPAEDAKKAKWYVDRLVKEQTPDPAEG